MLVVFLEHDGVEFFRFHLADVIDDGIEAEFLTSRTDIGSISGRSDIPFKEQVRLDKDYILAQGFWKDLAILLKTVPAIIGGKGAY